VINSVSVRHSQFLPPMSNICGQDQSIHGNTVPSIARKYLTRVEETDSDEHLQN